MLACDALVLAAVAFLPAALVNTAMVPATLSHGGHHLIDLLGGLAVFALGLWITQRLIRQPG